MQKSDHSVVESVAVIPGAKRIVNGIVTGQTKDSSERDEVWMIVKRTINGSTVRYIEFLEIDYTTGDDAEDAYYVDSMITYDSTVATALSGYDHLEGEALGIWADAAIQADKTVASGAITLDTAAAVVQAGLRYKHKFKALKITAGNPAGTPSGKIKRIYGVVFTLLNSHTIKFGSGTANLETKDFRVVSDPMDAGAPLFTGEKFYEFNGEYGRDVRIVIESDDPAPFTLLAIAPVIQENPLK